jgi:hypothetical protein
MAPMLLSVLCPRPSAQNEQVSTDILSAAPCLVPFLEAVTALEATTPTAAEETHDDMLLAPLRSAAAAAPQLANRLARWLIFSGGVY